MVLDLTDQDIQCLPLLVVSSCFEVSRSPRPKPASLSAARGLRRAADKPFTRLPGSSSSTRGRREWIGTPGGVRA